MKTFLLLLLGLLMVQPVYSQINGLFVTAESAIDSRQRNLLEKIEARPQSKSITLIKFDDITSIKDRTSLTFNLPKHGTLHVERSNHVMGHAEKFSWRGMPPSFGATIKLDVYGQNVIGVIQTLDFHYFIEPLGDGLHALVELDPTKFPAEAEPLRTVKSMIPEPMKEAPIGWNTVLSVPEIDVLVAYTTAAKNAHDDIEALIGTASGHIDDSFSNSDVPAIVNIVHMVEVSYTESGYLDTDISRIAGTADGYMDNIHTLRDQYGADLVALIVGSGDNCGIAYLKPSSNLAFSVTKSSCIAGYTFGHEVGHNIGTHHDKGTHTNNYFSYGHGYKYSTGGWRTIMAYASSVNPETRINYWSNPNVSLGSIPMGTATDEDNARVWDDRAATVAAFKTPLGPPPSVTITGNTGMMEGGSEMFTANVSGGTSPFSYQWYVRHENDLYYSAVGTNSPYYTHTAGSPDGEYIKVEVTDSAWPTTNDEVFVTIIGLGSKLTTGLDVEQQWLEFDLVQNYPNPFNPTTAITFTLPEIADVVLQVFDVTGRQVAQLVGERKQAGRHDLSFDAYDLSSGVYIARLQMKGISGVVTTRSLKMQLLK